MVDRWLPLEDLMTTIELNLLTDDDFAIRLCREYWQLGDDGRFTFTVAQLAAKYNLAASKVATRVAAACVAYLPEQSCTCGRARPLTSRSQYESFRRHRPFLERWVCAECMRAERLRAEQEAERQERVRAAILQQEVDCRAKDAVLNGTLSFTETIYLVTLIRAGGSNDLSFIWPRNSLATPLSPTAELDYTILTHLFRAGMLCAHPHTAAGSIAIEDGRLASVDPFETRWVLPLPSCGPSPAQFLEREENILRSDDWPEGWREEAEALAQEVALHECLRYVEVALEAHHFNARFGEKMRVVLRSALQGFSIGQVYNFIWNAAKNVASFYLQKRVHPVHAVNTMPGSIQRQAENARASKREVYAYRRDFRAPESQISQVLFTLALRLPNGGFGTVIAPVSPSHRSPEPQPADPR